MWIVQVRGARTRGERREGDRGEAVKTKKHECPTGQGTNEPKGYSGSSDNSSSGWGHVADDGRFPRHIGCDAAKGTATFLWCRFVGRKAFASPTSQPAAVRMVGRHLRRDMHGRRRSTSSSLGSGIFGEKSASVRCCTASLPESTSAANHQVLSREGIRLDNAAGVAGLFTTFISGRRPWCAIFSLLSRAVPGGSRAGLW
ncbi:uncharacterized protein EI97DRAFT_217491 [Westerdykella ornata]|uniref:Uncharacterized protein n=1 Tax=Westerdykella ornata TaxID=318751 RepID=A0A6A6JRI9_WESOR|nr:uncharacterized protein EI97DRAFT_217491 [Westerdykella ornata]KAF2278733.1 hypothetical protein EI97DRAFT_217491 [Westerdykella ornata]